MPPHDKKTKIIDNIPYKLTLLTGKKTVGFQ